jgi:transposase
VSNRKGRPNYEPGYKRQVAIAACAPNISVAKLAQSHGLNPNMVFKWRREYRAGLLGESNGGELLLMPVAVTPEAPAEPAMQRPAEPVREPAPLPGIEIELNGARVRVTGMVDPNQLRLILHCLMPA